MDDEQQEQEQRPWFELLRRLCMKDDMREDNTIRIDT